MSTISPRRVTYEAAMAEAGRRLADGDAAAAFASLERAHVLGQRDFIPHLRVHWRMLRLAWSSGNGRELRGQLMRIALTPFGHLSGRLPIGNTGGANVNAFEPMAIPLDLQALLSDRPGDISPGTARTDGQRAD